MNLTQMVVTVICIFAVLLIVIAYGQAVGSSWDPVAQGVAGAILFVAVFAVVVFGAVESMRS